MILSPPFPDLVWGASTLHAPAVEIPSDLYADDIEDFLGTQDGGALDEEDFFSPHDADVLALPYRVDCGSSRRWYGRLSQRSGHVCARAKITPVASWLFIDMDPTGSAPWGDLPTEAALSTVYPDAWCVYSTPKGVRVVVDTEPFPVTHYHNVAAWLMRQIGEVTLAGRTLVPDPSCNQWNRLQRLPRATRHDAQSKYGLPPGPLESVVWRRS